MANLTLIYGMRLIPEDEALSVTDAVIHLNNGRRSRVTMHVIEGTQKEIRERLNSNLQTFFDQFPEV